MAYTVQTWTNGSGGGTPLSAARLSHIEAGVLAAHNEKAALAGATFTGGVSAPSLAVGGAATAGSVSASGNVTAVNLTGCIGIPVGGSVPAGVPVGTVVVEY